MDAAVNERRTFLQRQKTFDYEPVESFNNNLEFRKPSLVKFQDENIVNVDLSKNSKNASENKDKNPESDCKVKNQHVYVGSFDVGGQIDSNQISFVLRLIL